MADVNSLPHGAAAPIADGETAVVHSNIVYLVVLRVLVNFMERPELVRGLDSTGTISPGY